MRVGRLNSVAQDQLFVIPVLRREPGLACRPGLPKDKASDIGHDAVVWGGLLLPRVRKRLRFPHHPQQIEKKKEGYYAYVKTSDLTLAGLPWARGTSEIPKHSPIIHGKRQAGPGTD
jgi:hypothetical protein